MEITYFLKIKNEFLLSYCNSQLMKYQHKKLPSKIETMHIKSVAIIIINYCILFIFSMLKLFIY